MLSDPDAGRLGIEEGDLVEVASPRGTVRARARITGVREGVVFLPSHYGYWDQPGGDRPDGDNLRAANEITLTDWDPVSKQPIYKTAAGATPRVPPPPGSAAPQADRPPVSAPSCSARF